MGYILVVSLVVIYAVVLSFNKEKENKCESCNNNSCTRSDINE